MPELTFESWIQYGAMAAAIIALLVKIKGMKRYVAVGLFASFYANAWCVVAATYHLWHFPSRIAPAVKALSVPFNFIVVPVIAMFWVRYFPLRLREQLLWAFVWTTALTGAEFLFERFTGLLRYDNGYQWFYSYILWFLSFFIWYGFHLWLNGGHRDYDSLFR